MWHQLKLESVGKIERIVAEFTVWMVDILPYAKMKVKIYENQCGTYEGMTDLGIKRKFDGYPECALGCGGSIEEALENTIKNFNEMLKEDGLEELKEDDIEYSAYSDF